MAGSDIYRDQLYVLHFGCALWQPDPAGEYSSVEVGDVGFVRRGFFHRFFNILLTADDPSQGPSVPEDFQPLVYAGLTEREPKIHHEVLTQNLFTSHSVCQVEAEVKLDSPQLAINGDIVLKCLRERGAALAIDDHASSEDAIHPGFFRKYMRKNWESWVAFSESREFEIKPEDIIIITGRDLARSWAVAAFGEGHVEAKLALGANATIVSGSAALGVTWTGGSHPYRHHGPIARRPAPGMTDIDPTRKNQCIFIRGYRAKRRFLGRLFPKVLKAAAEPRDDFDSNQEYPTPHASMSGCLESGDIVLETLTDAAARDPMSAILDYILDNSTADLAIVHSDQLRHFLDMTSDQVFAFDCVRSTLSRVRPAIVVHDGAASIELGEISSDGPAQGTTSTAPSIDHGAATEELPSCILSKPGQGSDEMHDRRAEVSSMPRRDLKPLLDGSRLWAVLIGINTYPFDHRVPNLSGAVSDALSMYDYLTNDLGVPSSNVRLLTEGEIDPPPWGPPTRDNILNALYNHLRDNKLVKLGDNMLIFFAGHGSSYSLSRVVGGIPGFVEAICPADRGRNVGAGVIPDISDREINIFLSELRVKKGANITVINDCCYSTEVARELDQKLPPRFAEPLPDTSTHSQLDFLLTAADNDPRRTPWSQKALSDLYEPDDSSCVHLSACNDYEQAHEFRHRSGAIHGVFTHHLLTELRASNNETTYLDLQANLRPSVSQQPQIIGSRVHCRLWYPEDLRSVQKGAPRDTQAGPSTSWQHSFESLANSEEIVAHTVYPASESLAGRSRRYTTHYNTSSERKRRERFTSHDTISSPGYANQNSTTSFGIQRSAHSVVTGVGSLPALRPQKTDLKNPEARGLSRSPSDAKSKGRQRRRGLAPQSTPEALRSVSLNPSFEDGVYPDHRLREALLAKRIMQEKEMQAKRRDDESRCCIM